MTWNLKKSNKQKHLFRSYYCSSCNQIKPCQLLDQLECCQCVYQKEQVKAEEYSSYERLLVSKQEEKREQYQQLRLLKSYLGCSQCGSKAVDAYCLYSESRLVCQPCLMRKESGSSSPISLKEQQKWYKKFWEIDLTEWLEKFSQLPVNAKCAKEWLKDREHLDKCDCLEVEVQKLYELFANSLKEMEERLKDCQCKRSEKVRVSSDYYAWCERCEGSIKAASKKRVIKNRNDVRFWGIESKWQILCLECIGKEFYKEMEGWQRKKFREYRRRGYV